MKISVKILTKYARNGIISFKSLKSANLRMLRYLQSNRVVLSSLLLNEGIELLDDLSTPKKPADLTLYLKYHFGSKVNLTDLRKGHRPVYRAIDQIGTPRLLLKEWGFSVSYQGIWTEEMLIEHLRNLADTFGKVNLNRDLYNKVLYRAAPHSVEEYLNCLGLCTSKIDSMEIVRLKDEQKMSFRQIGEKLGISKSAAQSHYVSTKKG